MHRRMMRSRPVNSAFVTLLLGDAYLPGVIALANSLERAKSRYPLIVMFRKNRQDIRSLKNNNIILCPMDSIPFSEAFCQKHSRSYQHKHSPFTKGRKPCFHQPLDNFYKLCLWTLTDYDSLVFLDADLVVIRNIDKLMEYPEGCAAPNLYETLDDFNRMNSGVFTARPSLKTFDWMIAALDKPGAYWKRTDQTFLQSIWPDWQGLPYTYNALQYLYYNIPVLWRWDQIRVVHYQYEKPWEKDNPKKDQLQLLIQLWESFYYGDALPEKVLKMMGTSS